jgi:hypothetical protein
MTGEQRARLDAIKDVLTDVGFESRFITDQTAICLMALADEGAGRGDLLPGMTVRASETS